MSKNIISVCVRKIIEAIPLLLFINLIYQILCFGYCDQNVFSQSCYSNTTYLIVYFGLMGFGFLYTFKDRIAKLTISMKDGIHAELLEIQKAKNEVRDLAIRMMSCYVTLLENSNRWAGWSDVRYNKEIASITSQCGELETTDAERKKIFATKVFWDRIDALGLIVKLIQGALESQDGLLLQAEWDKVVNAEQELSADFLTKYLDKSSLEESQKSELRSKIAKFNKDLP